MRIYLFFVLVFLSSPIFSQNQFVIYTLGIAQDAGYPQAGCEKDCCKDAWKDANKRKMAACIAIADTLHKTWWMVEASPDFKEQLNLFRNLTNQQYKYLPNGIFITHAHIGHYTGLIQLGREVMNTYKIPVFVLPKLKKYLSQNGPWSQLVTLNNIELHELTINTETNIAKGFTATAFQVPHRDEFSETAGFSFFLNNKKVVFIPDIDKWQKFSDNIPNTFSNISLAFIDGTFFKDGELVGRAMSEVPHPFVTESMNLFKDWNNALKSSIQFIHFNHTNPLIKNKSKEKNIVTMNKFNVAVQGKLYSIN